MRKARVRLVVALAAIILSAQPALPLLTRLLPEPDTCGMACCRRSRICCCRAARSHPHAGMPVWTAGSACAPECGRLISTAPLPPVVAARPVAAFGYAQAGHVLSLAPAAGLAATANPFALFQRPPPAL